MLGRLLHLGSGNSTQPSTQASQSSSKPVSSLESVHEDIHTRHLLFPDAETLYQSRHDQVFELSTTPSALSANAFDFSDDIDLDVKDVRIVIIQDTLGPTHTTLLYDSHPAPSSSNATSPTNAEVNVSGYDNGKHNPTSGSSSRKGSLSHPARPFLIQGDTFHPRHGAFDRRASLHSRTQSQAETDAQRIAREYREELATISSCIFGNSELMAYKGTSTKVHVVPSDTRPIDHGIPAIVEDGRSSIGRSSGRSSKLSQSFTSSTFSPTQPHTISTNSKPADRKKVLITRLFPVNLPNEDVESNPGAQNRFPDESAEFPFPAPAEETMPRKKKTQPRQRRTPMYAVVLVITLPTTNSRINSAAPPKNAGRGDMGSDTDQDIFPSSYNSARFGGWNMNSSSNFDLNESIYPMDLEDRMDHLTQHWDVIMRTLNNLQSVVATTLFGLLKQVDVASPGPLPTSVPSSYVSRPPSIPDRRSVDIPRAKTPKSTTKLVSLGANCLVGDENIVQQVESARDRIVSGVSAARVVTGQGRWGIWRDEATWVSKWTIPVSGKPNKFLPKLFTGFLATHTDWLQALCPPYYRRRAFLNHQKQTEEDVPLYGRTVIVSDNKMAARRLIFLLSAFLPANQQVPHSQSHRPSTSMSFGPLTNSPPTFVVPVLREESLRRKINRRSGLRRHSRNSSQTQAHRGSTVPSQLAHLTIEKSYERRPSDAGSIRPAALPMTGSDLVSRKSSVATTTTIIQETTLPHFASAQRAPSQWRTHQDNTTSIAADDLKRSLTRGDSNNQTNSTGSDSRNQSSRWGSIMSGLWTPRRRGSTDQSSFIQDGETVPTTKPISRPDNKLAQMVQEVSMAEEEDEEDGEDHIAPDMQRPANAKTSGSVRTPRESFTRFRDSFNQTNRTPDPGSAFDSPVKTSINVEDGVIDVDVPFPDYITHFESAISSPSSSGYLSTPGLPSGLEAFEQAARASVDGDTPLNAAGWLNSYHPDFALQAIPPQEDLMDQVKASLRAEPTPPSFINSVSELSERWVDVSSILVADTRTQSIIRLVYRRLVRPKASQEKLGSSYSAPPNLSSGTLLTPSIIPTEITVQEEWIEETVLQADDLLSGALDKVLNLNSSPVKTPRQDQGDGSDEGGHTPVASVMSTSTEVPGLAFDVPRGQCKTVILSALEQRIREMVDRRNNDGNMAVPARDPARGQNLLKDAVRNWMNELDLVDA